VKHKLPVMKNKISGEIQNGKKKSKGVARATLTKITMTNSAVVASDALKGVISLVLMFLNGIQWFDMQSSQAPALRKNIYWAILVGLFLGFIQFLGENEPLIFPWQLVAFCLSCTQVICALLAVYLAHSVMFANYQTVNLGKKLPAWVTHSFSILALVYILAAVVSLGLGLAYNEIRFFAIRVAATGIFVGVAVLAFSFEMASLYRQAKASMEKHWLWKIKNPSVHS